MQLKCHICEEDIDLPANPTSGSRITCPRCFAQLGAYNVKGKWVLGCAMCKVTTFDPMNCGECERKREKQLLLEEGKL
jgi:hypothetical protein